MSSVNARHIPPIVAVCAILCSAVWIGAQPRYTLTDLGNFADASAFWPAAIAGPWIVGSQNNLPMLYHHPTATMFPLQHLGYGGTAAAVLDNGVAAGWVGVRQGDSILQAACLWNEAGDVTLLPGAMPSSAEGLNHALTVAVRGNIADLGRLEVRRIWADGRVDILGVGHAVGIDDEHRVWGWLNCRTDSCAAMWDVNGHLTNFGPHRPDHLGTTMAVSRAGVATGKAGQPWTLTVDGGFVPLVKQERYKGISYGECSGLGINTQCHVVGNCGITPYDAFLWTDPQTVVRLQDVVTPAPTPVLSSGYGINDEGHILASGRDGRAYLLTPQPPAIDVALNLTTPAAG